MSYSSGSQTIHLCLDRIHVNSIITARYLKGFEQAIILTKMFGIKITQFQSFWK